MREQRNALEEAVYIATESGKEMVEDFKQLQEKLEFSHKLNKQLRGQVDQLTSAHERARSFKTVGKALLAGLAFGFAIGFSIRK